MPPVPDFYQGIIDPFQAELQRSALRRQQRALSAGRDFIKLDDPTRASVLSTLGRGTLGAASRFSNFLDIPGSVVRDVASSLTGRFENPIDQLLPWNWTTEQGRITGRELNRRLGLVGPRDTWGNWAGGLGTEILLDPLTYLSFGAGAATKLGKLGSAADLMKYAPMAAKQTGKGIREFKLTGTIDDLVEAAGGTTTRAAKRAEDAAKAMGYRDLAHASQELGAGFQDLGRFGLPRWKFLGGADAPGFHFGRGAAGVPAAKVMDAIGGAAMAAKPLRALRSLFDSPMMGAFHDRLRLPEFTKGYHKRFEAETLAKEQWNNLFREFNSTDAGKKLLDNSDELRSLLEDPTGWQHKAAPEVYRALQMTRDLTETLIQKRDELGIDVSWLDDFWSEYFPRFLTNSIARGLPASNAAGMDMLASVIHMPLHTVTASDLSRDAILRDVIGGTETLQALFKDDALHRLVDQLKTRVASGQLSANKAHGIVASRIKRKYGAQVKDWHRGRELSMVEGTARRQPGIAVKEQIFNDSFVKNILADPKLTDAQKITEVNRHLRNTYEATLGRNADLSMTHDATKIYEFHKGGRYKLLAKAMMQQSEQSRLHGLFGNEPLADLQRHLVMAHDSVVKAEAVHDVVMDVFRDPTALYNQGGMQLSRVLGDMNMSGAVSKLAEKLAPIHGQTVDKMEDLLRAAKLPEGITRDLKRMHDFFAGPEPAKMLIDWLDQFKAWWKSNMTMPFPAFHVRNLSSGQIQNMLTSMFSRQALDGAWRLLRGGETIEGLKDASAIKSRHAEMVQAGHKLGRLTDELAMDLARDMAEEYSLIGRYGEAGTSGVPHAGATITASGQPGTVAEVRQGRPGEVPFSFGRTANLYFGRKIPVGPPGKQVPTKVTELGLGVIPLPNVLRPTWLAKKLFKKQQGKAFEWEMPSYSKVRGVRGAESTTFGPVRGGEDASYWVEGMNRLTPFLHQIMKGDSAAAAAAKANLAQLNYDPRTFTNFERQVMQRVFPFYSYMRKSLPFHLKFYGEHPGNILTHMMRVLNSMRHEEVMPEHIAAGMHIPVPARLPGHQAFMTGLGIMPEDTWSLMGPLLGGRFGESMSDLLSRSAPYLKMPAEMATGVSTFQRGVEGGRPLRELDPLGGRVISNLQHYARKYLGQEPQVDVEASNVLGPFEHFLANSPASRYFSSLRQGTDYRKKALVRAANLLTGVKTYNLSPELYEATLIDTLADAMRQRGGHEFTKVTFNQEQLARMSPQERQAALQLMAVSDEITRVKQLRKRAQDVLSGAR